MKKVSIPLKQYSQLFRSYLRPQWPSVVWLTVLLLFGIALQLISPQIVRYFIDSAESQATLQALLRAALLFIGVSVIYQLIGVAASYLGEHIGWIATNRLRGDVADHCLRLDMSFHKTLTSGALIERVDGDINNLANFFSHFVVTLLSNLVLVIGIIVLLYREGWLIGTAMLVFTVFALYAIQHIRKYAVPHWGRLRQIHAEFFGFLGEHLEGTEDTRANGGTGYVMHRFHLMLRVWLPLRIKAFMGWAAMWITTIIVFAIGTAVTFAVSAYLFRQGDITMGTVYMIFYYTELMAKPIEKIRTQMEDLQKADASIVRVRELLATPSAIQDGSGLPLPKGALALQVEQVDFSYEKEGQHVLQQLSFHLPSGQVLGLLGRTGSGKTTLARMLLRFYDPTGGAIRLGGVDLRETALRDLRAKVGMVTQTIEIFQGSVRDNLTFYNEEISDERIAAVLEELGLRAWLRSLPDGLDTMLESGGGGLSAGEAQLLSFARVFLSDPGLVILDEASSRLDPATEYKIEQAVSKLLEGRTCIIIAHRLSTIARADQIAVLEDGRLVEFGERQSLAQDRESRFHRMLTAGMEELLS